MEPYRNTGPIDTTQETNTSSLKGRTAIVTGGADGIGFAYSKALTSAGAYVVLADVNEELGQKRQQELGSTSAFVKCDVRNWSDQVAAFKKAIELSPEGQIDIVVANAGVGGRDTTWEYDPSEQEPSKPDLRTLDINVDGVLYTSRLAFWYFRKQQAELGEGKGRDRSLVLQASVAGYLDLPTPQYQMSKFGVRGLMRALRRAAPLHGVRVNLIAPWYIHTAIVGTELPKAVDHSGAGWATVEDAGSALLRITSDPQVVGRAIAIVPRDWEGGSKGFMDLAMDDFEEGTFQRKIQDLALAPMFSMPTQ